MNTNKKKFLIVFFLLFSFFNAQAEDKTNLDDEELPAIDPFQGGAGSSTSGSEGLSSQGASVGGGMLNGLRLVGTLIGENKKLAILSAPDGSTFKYKELQEINSNISVIEITSEYVLVQDESGNYYEVYMNNIIKPSDG